MIGSINPKQRQVTVIGAGFSGLLIAYELDRLGFEVTIYESENRAGGLIRTQKAERGIVESAAHSLIVTPEIRKLCADLGVELTAVRPESKARYILRDGRMRKFPLSPWEALTTFSRAYFVLSKEGMSRDRATMESWAKRHLGSAALDYLFSPFLTGIYAAKPSEISVGAAFRALEIPSGHSFLSHQLRRFRESLGKPKSEKRQMMAPLHGMGAVVEALDKRLSQRLGSRFRKGEKITELPRSQNVALTVPAASAAALLANSASELSEKLKQVQYSPLITATLFVPRDLLSKAPEGVGVLIPEAEKRESLGVLFNSSAFQNRVKDESSWVSLTMMLGGSSRPDLLTRSDAELYRVIEAELESLFKIKNDGRIEMHLQRWQNAVPQYSEQLMDLWDVARKTWCASPGHVLFGNYAGEVSLRGMVGSVDAMSRSLAAQLQS